MAGSSELLQGAQVLRLAKIPPGTGHLSLMALSARKIQLPGKLALGGGRNHDPIDLRYRHGLRVHRRQALLPSVPRPYRPNPPRLPPVTPLSREPPT